MLIEAQMLDIVLQPTIAKPLLAVRCFLNPFGCYYIFAVGLCLTGKLTEFAIKQSSFAFLCNSFALSTICSSVTVTIGFNVTSLNCPPPFDVSIIIPVALSI